MTATGKTLASAAIVVIQFVAQWLLGKLKGGAGSVCAQRASDLALALERTAEVASEAELAATVEQLQAALAECVRVIQVHFP